MTYKDEQRKRAEELMGSEIFNGDPGNGFFAGKARPFVLNNNLNNLYAPIKDEAIEYFDKNNVSWWGGNEPTAHVLSSQIACVNHLFPIRQDKEAVLNLLKSVSNDFVDVFPIDEHLEGYIQFEAVGGEKNNLSEGANTRGSNCTSVDALIMALHKNGKRFLIPIEWKYVEAYGNDDKSAGPKGSTRRGRYDELIDKSEYLNTERTQECCWQEPFYQLMRQTLWAEQLLIKRPKGFEADDYLHLHIIPDENAQLLDKVYKCSNMAMEETWKSCLTDPDKYVILSPEKFWSKQDLGTDVFGYLRGRYW